MEKDGGVKIEYERYNPPIGYYYLPNSPRIFAGNFTSLSKKEKEDLQFAFDILKGKTDLPLLRHGVEIINNLVNEKLEDFQESGVMVEANKSEVAGNDRIAELYTAVKNNQAICFDYASHGASPRRRTVSPYILREHKGMWYLVAYDHDETKPNITIKNFALHKIKKVRNAHVAFHSEKGFSASNYFKHSLGIFQDAQNDPIKVKFWTSAQDAQYLEIKKLHHSQKMLEYMNFKGIEGKVFEITVYDSDELVSLFLSRTPKLIALEPPELVKKVKKSLEDFLEKYSQ
jgi:predicted DNA-binding transcriptional regulator YafY